MFSVTVAKAYWNDRGKAMEDVLFALYVGLFSVTSIRSISRAVSRWLPSMSGCSLWQLYLSHFFDAIYTTFPISCQISPVFSFADFLKNKEKSVFKPFPSSWMITGNQRTIFRGKIRQKGLKIHTNPFLFLLFRLWNPHVSLLSRSNDWLLRKCYKQTENGP